MEWVVMKVLGGPEVAVVTKFHILNCCLKKWRRSRNNEVCIKTIIIIVIGIITDSISISIKVSIITSINKYIITSFNLSKKLSIEIRGTQV